MFTFGVGDDCDKQLVKKCAEFGKGSYSFAEDSNLNVLKAKVIDALQKASDPSLADCSFDFGIKSEKVDPESLIDPSVKNYSPQIFRNSLQRYFTIMKEDQFENELCCTFSSKFDPRSKSEQHTEFGKDAFTQLYSEDKNYLFKLACKAELDRLNASEFNYWTCPNCTYENSGNSRCAMCEFKKPKTT